MKNYKVIIILLLIAVVMIGCNESNEESFETIEDNFEPEVVQEVLTIDDVVDTIGDVEVEEKVVIEELLNDALLHGIIGEVMIDRNNEIFIVSEGVSVLEGDVIFTGAESSVDLVIGADIKVTLGENTILLLSMNEEISENKKIVIALKVGTCISKLDEKLNENSKFEIMTPAQITSIRGTVASVTFDENLSASEIVFFEGYGVVADIATKRVVPIVVGQSLKLLDGNFEFSIIDKESLSSANIKYVENNVELFAACLLTIEESPIDLSKEVDTIAEIEKFQIDYEEVPTNFYESESEVEIEIREKMNNSKKGTGQQNNKDNPNKSNENKDKVKDTKKPGS